MAYRRRPVPDTDEEDDLYRYMFQQPGQQSSNGNFNKQSNQRHQNYGGGGFQPNNITPNDFSSRSAFFYPEGDSSAQPYRVIVTKPRYPTFETLLDDLNRKVILPRGVRAIFTPKGRHMVEDLEDIEQGGIYICSSNYFRGVETKVNSKAKAKSNYWHTPKFVKDKYVPGDSQLLDYRNVPPMKRSRQGYVSDVNSNQNSPRFPPIRQTNNQTPGARYYSEDEVRVRKPRQKASLPPVIQAWGGIGEVKRNNKAPLRAASPSPFVQINKSRRQNSGLKRLTHGPWHDGKENRNKNDYQPANPWAGGPGYRGDDYVLPPAMQPEFATAYFNKEVAPPQKNKPKKGAIRGQESNLTRFFNDQR